MSEDKPLKSAYELAMERLREQGAEEPAALSDEQKERIAELRSRARARLAEIDIMHAKRVASFTGDPAELGQLEEQLKTDRARVESKLESDVARVRRGEEPDED